MTSEMVPDGTDTPLGGWGAREDSEIKRNYTTLADTNGIALENAT